MAVPFVLGNPGGGGKRLGDPISRAGPPVALCPKRRAHAKPCAPRKPQVGLVGVRQGARMAGPNQIPGAGSGCPVCANRQILPAENDLASRFPEIAAQWHPTKNKMLAPDMVAREASEKFGGFAVRGMKWRTVVFARTSGGSGCPVCSGSGVLAGENDLASKFPDIAAQWHPTKNGTLTPEQVTSVPTERSGGSAL